MSHEYLRLAAAILVIAAATLTLFMAFKRRISLMLIAMGIMMLVLGEEQVLTQPHWLAYVSFASAGLCVISLIVRTLRGDPL
jgi:hypothetical protein